MTGGSVAEMWVNVGSFVITIIMPGLVSACQGMEESVTPSPGVNSYESRPGVEDENASPGSPRVVTCVMPQRTWMLNDSSRVFNVAAASFCWDVTS